METTDGLIGNIFTWFSHPFNKEGSALNWVLFVGLLIIGAWMWNHILLSITES